MQHLFTKISYTLKGIQEVQVRCKYSGSFGAILNYNLASLNKLFGLRLYYRHLDWISTYILHYKWLKTAFEFIKRKPNKILTFISFYAYCDWEVHVMTQAVRRRLLNHKNTVSHDIRTGFYLNFCGFSQLISTAADPSVRAVKAWFCGRSLAPTMGGMDVCLL